MAEKLGTVTVNGIWIVESDTNPTLGGGLTAPIGSIISASDGSGMFYKTGALDTDYTKVPVTNSTLPATATTGDILYASATNVYSNLADVATGNALISGGVGVAPSYGKIGLATHISGILGVGNGGTGTATAFTAGSIVFAGVSGVYTQDNAMFFWDDTNNIFYVGINSGAFANTKAHFQATVNGYSQINSINKSAGTSASADYITTNDTGTDIINYTDVGINSSTYADPAYTIGGANAGYLYCNGGDLTIGTQTATKNIIFHTGGTLIANKRMEINDNGYRLMPLGVPVALLSGKTWNDSTQLSIGVNQAIGNIFYSGFLSGNTANSNTVVSTTAETNFTTNSSTFVIPANSLAVNKRIRVTAWGIYSAVLGNTLTIRLKTGATTLLTTGARPQQTATVVDVGFKFEAIILVRTLGAGGTAVCNMSTIFNETPFADGSVVPSSGTKAFNTTVANTIQFSAQWGTSSASNSITIEDVLFEVLN